MKKKNMLTLFAGFAVCVTAISVSNSLYAAPDYLKEVDLPFTPPEGFDVPKEMATLVEELLKNPDKLRTNPELMEPMPKPMQQYFKGLLLIPEEKRRLILGKAVLAAEKQGHHRRLADGPSAKLEMVRLARPVEEFGSNERECFLVRIADKSSGLLYGLCLVSLDAKSVKVLYSADISTDYLPQLREKEE